MARGAFLGMIETYQALRRGVKENRCDPFHFQMKPTFKNFARRHTGGLCSNWPEIAIPAQKINLDNKGRFGYPDGYCLR
jgi:hypothetical protein